MNSATSAKTLRVRRAMVPLALAKQTGAFADVCSASLSHTKTFQVKNEILCKVDYVGLLSKENIVKKHTKAKRGPSTLLKIKRALVLVVRDSGWQGWKIANLRLARLIQ